MSASAEKYVASEPTSKPARSSSVIDNNVIVVGSINTSSPVVTVITALTGTDAGAAPGEGVGGAHRLSPGALTR